MTHTLIRDTTQRPTISSKIASPPLDSHAVKLDPRSLFNKNTAADARAQNASKKAAAKAGQATQLEGPERISADEDAVDTGSGSGSATKKKLGGDATFSASTSSPLADRAHIINKEALEQKALAGPGSLDPKDLGPPGVPDARRWLAKRGVELLVPEGWRFMGQQHEGRGISFNHSGTAEGHSLEVATWRLADDIPREKFLQPYLEEAEDLARLGRLAGHETMKVGDVDGVLLVGWGPDSKAELQTANPEALYLATDGTGRRNLSWRGVVQRNNENQLYIVSFSSPIETFMDARAVYDAILKNTRIVS
jgi:hypothetical protein